MKSLNFQSRYYKKWAWFWSKYTFYKSVLPMEEMKTKREVITLLLI
jgi:hypothetical protein